VVEAEIRAPKFGAGLGGGNWVFIEELMNDIWIKRDIPVYIYDPLDSDLPVDYTNAYSPIVHRYLDVTSVPQNDREVLFILKLSSDQDQSRLCWDTYWIFRQQGLSCHDAWKKAISPPLPSPTL
jgi:hypothetical protein